MFKNCYLFVLLCFNYTAASLNLYRRIAPGSVSLHTCFHPFDLCERSSSRRVWFGSNCSYIASFPPATAFT